MQGYINQETQLKDGFVDFSLLVDSTEQSSFYASCELMTDIEDINSKSTTYRLMEDSHNILFSNGIQYDKDNDIIYSPNYSCRNQYSRLLLGYDIDIISLYEYYDNFKNPTQFGIISDDENHLGIVKNTSIGVKGLLDNEGLKRFTLSSDLDSLKIFVNQKNADTYVDLKTEKLFPHELYWSIINLDISTAYDPSVYYTRFSNTVSSVSSKLGQNFTNITSLAQEYLITIYGLDPVVNALFQNFKTYTVSSHHLSTYVVNDDNTNNIILNSYIGLEHLYSYKFTDFSNTIDAINEYVHDTYSVNTDLIKYILPPIKTKDLKVLQSQDKYFGLCSKTSPYISKLSYNCGDIVDISADINNIYIYRVNSAVLYYTIYPKSTIKTDFYSLFPDLSSAYVGLLIDELIDLNIYNTIRRPPILMMSDSSYTAYSSVSNIGKLYVMSVIMSKILSGIDLSSDYTSLSDVVYEFEPLVTMETNLFQVSYADYINLTPLATKQLTYSGYIKTINFLNKIFPLEFNVFNPSVYDEIRDNIVMIEGYTSSYQKFITTPDSELLGAIGENIIDQSTEIGTSYLITTSDEDIIDNLFILSDTTNLKYTSEPDNLYTIEVDNNVPDIDDITMVFTNDNTRFQYVPVDLVINNILSIPYQGLFMLHNVVDSEYIELVDLYINREPSANEQKVKIQLNKYDQQNVNRTIYFNLYGDSSVVISQPVKYEFGLGFELVSSDNVTDTELMKVLYILMNAENRNNNIYVEKLQQDPSRLKLIFKKLTDQEFVLRTTTGYKTTEEIINITNTTI